MFIITWQSAEVVLFKPPLLRECRNSWEVRLVRYQYNLPWSQCFPNVKVPQMASLYGTGTRSQWFCRQTFVHNNPEALPVKLFWLQIDFLFFFIMWKGIEGWLFTFWHGHKIKTCNYSRREKGTKFWCSIQFRSNDIYIRVFLWNCNYHIKIWKSY